MCVPGNVHTHTNRQLIATYVAAVITAVRDELTADTVRVPEFTRVYVLGITDGRSSIQGELESFIERVNEPG